MTDYGEIPPVESSNEASKPNSIKTDSKEDSKHIITHDNLQLLQKDSEKMSKDEKITVSKKSEDVCTLDRLNWTTKSGEESEKSGQVAPEKIRIPEDIILSLESEKKAVSEQMNTYEEIEKFWSSSLNINKEPNKLPVPLKNLDETIISRKLDTCTMHEEENDETSDNKVDLEDDSTKISLADYSNLDRVVEELTDRIEKRAKLSFSRKSLEKIQQTNYLNSVHNMYSDKWENICLQSANVCTFDRLNLTTKSGKESGESEQIASDQIFASEDIILSLESERQSVTEQVNSSEEIEEICSPSLNMSMGSNKISASPQDLGEISIPDQLETSTINEEENDKISDTEKIDGIYDSEKISLADDSNYGTVVNAVTDKIEKLEKMAVPGESLEEIQQAPKLNAVHGMKTEVSENICLQSEDVCTLDKFDITTKSVEESNESEQIASDKICASEDIILSLGSERQSVSKQVNSPEEIEEICSSSLNMSMGSNKISASPQDLGEISIPDQLETSTINEEENDKISDTKNIDGIDDSKKIPLADESNYGTVVDGVTDKIEEREKMAVSGESLEQIQQAPKLNAVHGMKTEESENICLQSEDVCTLDKFDITTKSGEESEESEQIASDPICASENIILSLESEKTAVSEQVSTPKKTEEICLSSLNMSKGSNAISASPALGKISIPDKLNTSFMNEEENVKISDIAKIDDIINDSKKTPLANDSDYGTEVEDVTDKIEEHEKKTVSVESLEEIQTTHNLTLVHDMKSHESETVCSQSEDVSTLDKWNLTTKSGEESEESGHIASEKVCASEDIILSLRSEMKAVSDQVDISKEIEEICSSSLNMSKRSNEISTSPRNLGKISIPDKLDTSTINEEENDKISDTEKTDGIDDLTKNPLADESNYGTMVEEVTDKIEEREKMTVSGSSLEEIQQAPKLNAVHCMKTYDSENICLQSDDVYTLDSLNSSTKSGEENKEFGLIASAKVLASENIILSLESQTKSLSDQVNTSKEIEEIGSSSLSLSERSNEISASPKNLGEISILKNLNTSMMNEEGNDKISDSGEMDDVIVDSKKIPLADGPNFGTVVEEVTDKIEEREKVTLSGESVEEIQQIHNSISVHGMKTDESGHICLLDHSDSNTFVEEITDNKILDHDVITLSGPNSEETQPNYNSNLLVDDDEPEKTTSKEIPEDSSSQQISDSKPLASSSESNLSSTSNAKINEILEPRNIEDSYVTFSSNIYVSFGENICSNTEYLNEIISKPNFSLDTVSPEDFDGIMNAALEIELEEINTADKSNLATSVEDVTGLDSEQIHVFDGSSLQEYFDLNPANKEGIYEVQGTGELIYCETNSEDSSRLNSSDSNIGSKKANQTVWEPQETFISNLNTQDSPKISEQEGIYEVQETGESTYRETNFEGSSRPNSSDSNTEPEKANQTVWEPQETFISNENTQEGPKTSKQERIYEVQETGESTCCETNSKDSFRPNKSDSNTEPEKANQTGWKTQETLDSNENTQENPKTSEQEGIYEVQETEELAYCKTNSDDSFRLNSSDLNTESEKANQTVWETQETFNSNENSQESPGTSEQEDDDTPPEENGEEYDIIQTEENGYVSDEDEGAPPRKKRKISTIRRSLPQRRSSILRSLAISTKRGYSTTPYCALESGYNLDNLQDMNTEHTEDYTENGYENDTNSLAECDMVSQNSGTASSIDRNDDMAILTDFLTNENEHFGNESGSESDRSAVTVIDTESCEKDLVLKKIVINEVSEKQQTSNDSNLQSSSTKTLDEVSSSGVFSGSPSNSGSGSATSLSGIEEEKEMLYDTVFRRKCLKIETLVAKMTFSRLNPFDAQSLNKKVAKGTKKKDETVIKTVSPDCKPYKELKSPTKVKKEKAAESGKHCAVETIDKLEEIFSMVITTGYNELIRYQNFYCDQPEGPDIARDVIRDLKTFLQPFKAKIVESVPSEYCRPFVNPLSNAMQPIYQYLKDDQIVSETIQEKFNFKKFPPSDREIYEPLPVAGTFTNRTNGIRFAPPEREFHQPLQEEPYSGIRMRGREQNCPTNPQFLNHASNYFYDPSENRLFVEGCHPKIHAWGLVEIPFLYDITVLLTLNLGVLMYNRREKVFIALSADGKLAGMRFRYGECFSNSEYTDINCVDSYRKIHKRVRLSSKGPCFQKRGSPLVYHLSTSGVTTSCHTLNSLINPDFIGEILYSGSKFGEEYISDCAAMIKSARYDISTDGIMSWIVKNVKIKQSPDGQVVLHRDRAEFTIIMHPHRREPDTNVSFYSGRLTSPHIHFTCDVSKVIFGSKHKFFVKQDEKRMFATEKSFVVRNNNLTAGVDENQTIYI